MENQFKRIILHARNLTGLGSGLIYKALLPHIEQYCSDHNVTLKVITPTARFNSFYRMFDILFFFLTVRTSDRVIVLGDLPLFFIRNQIVFVQQAHLIKPTFNLNVGRTKKFKFMRFLFKLGKAFPRKFICQTNHMKSALMESYHLMPNQIEVAPHFSPIELKPSQKMENSDKNIFLFYPAFPYPHKNFDLLYKTALQIENKLQTVRFVVATFPGMENLKSLYKNIDFRNIPPGPKALVEVYQTCAAVFFPSLLESYGLPILEAGQLHRSAIVSDLPYARELCGEGAYYFDPMSAESAANAIERFVKDFEEGKSQKLSPHKMIDWNTFAKLLAGT